MRQDLTALPSLLVPFYSLLSRVGTASDWRVRPVAKRRAKFLRTVYHREMADSENVITKTTDFIQWFLPKIEKMPRNYKFLFGERIVTVQLDLLERLIEAYYSKEKLRPLAAANIEIEKLRQILRICVDLHWISLPQYEFATRELNQIGGMAGGWARQQRQRTGAAAVEHGPQ